MNVPGAGVETHLNAIFDLAKRWQRAKATRRVLGPWWNVLRAGFETLRVSGPGGTCFAQVLKPSYMQNPDLARQGQRAKGAQEGFVS